MDTNQNTPLCFYRVKIWCILPGQQSVHRFDQLKIMAYTELVQEGTLRYFWGNKAYTNKKSRIRETDADSSIDIFVSAGVQKGADSIFFLF